MGEELCCLAGQPFLCRSAALRPRALRPQLKRDPLGSAQPQNTPSRFMAKYPMTEVIARREFQFTGPEGQVKVVASIGRPAVMPDAQHGDWYCPWQIDGPDRGRQLYGAGVDTMQALLLALSGMRTDLEMIARKGSSHSSVKLTLESSSLVALPNKRLKLAGAHK